MSRYHRWAFQLLGGRIPKPEGCLDGDTIRLSWYDGIPNLGDAISPLLVKHLAGRPVTRASDRAHGKLLAVGSILNRARDGDVVWGSGLISPDAGPEGVRILVTAVRGPRTAARLRERGIECPDVYGDPGCLLPTLFPRPHDAVPRFDLGIIPHEQDQSLLTEDPSVRVIDILAPPEVFLAALWECRQVVSSTLHGIVFAEAYGIPARWLVMSDRVLGGGHKFADYYEGTERPCPTPLTLETKHAEPDWRPPPAAVADRLVAAFPFSRAAR